PAGGARAPVQGLAPAPAAGAFVFRTVAQGARSLRPSPETAGGGQTARGAAGPRGNRARSGLRFPRTGWELQPSASNCPGFRLFPPAYIPRAKSFHDGVIASPR